MCFVAYLIQPWRFVNAPGTFITVLSSFGMFVSPLAGINAIDFWIIRKKAWKVPDLYVGNSSSIYWYDFGWNWRAIVAWTLAVWPSFRKFFHPPLSFLPPPREAVLADSPFSHFCSRLHRSNQQDQSCPRLDANLPGLVVRRLPGRRPRVLDRLPDLPSSGETLRVGAVQSGREVSRGRLRQRLRGYGEGRHE